MSSRKNTGRREAARFALRSHAWAKGDAIGEDEYSIIDLLADLRHFCEAEDLCFASLDRIAYAHYVAERRNGGEP